jgi:hypothetical protein
MSSSILRSALASAMSSAFVLSVVATVTATAQSSPASTDLVIKNATVITGSYGTIQHGSVWLHNGNMPEWCNRECTCWLDSG